MPAGECREILATLCVGRVEKTRHYVPARGAHDDAVWEIDEFVGDNAGLVVAEIELLTIDATFERPLWLGRRSAERRVGKGWLGTCRSRWSRNSIKKHIKKHDKI